MLLHSVEILGEDLKTAAHFTLGGVCLAVAGEVVQEGSFLFTHLSAVEGEGVGWLILVEA